MAVQSPQHSVGSQSYDDDSASQRSEYSRPGKFKYYNQSPVKPVDIQLNSKTVQSTIDALDRIERTGWKKRDPILEEKSRRLRKLYNEDVTTHEHLRLRVVRTPEKGSAMAYTQQLLQANKNVVKNSRGYLPDRSSHSASNSNVSTSLYDKNKIRQSFFKAHPSKPASSNHPFYSPGKGLGPVSTTSLNARYGPTQSREGFTSHQDNTLEFNDELHNSIQVVDSAEKGSTKVSWPDLGESYIANNSDVLAPSAFTAAKGIFNPYSAPINEFGRISPCDWNMENAGSKSSLFQNSNSNGTVIPRGTARGIERKAIRDARVHELALQKRRKQAKLHAKWLQNSGSVLSSGSGKSRSKRSSSGSGSVDSFQTEFVGEQSQSQSMINSMFESSSSNHTPSSNNQQTKSKKFQSLKSYGEEATNAMNLMAKPENPYRQSMSLPSEAKKNEAKTAGVYSLIESKVGMNDRVTHISKAIARSTKSSILDTTNKIKEIAALAKRLLKSPNSLPGHEIVLVINQGLLDTAQENPDPRYISRTQFVKSMCSSLYEIEKDQFHRLYSSFDPYGRNKVSHADFCCVIMAVHRPSMNQLSSGRYHYARKYLDKLPVVSKLYLIYANGRAGITKKDLNVMLKCCEMSAEDKVTIDSLCELLFESMRAASKLNDDFQLISEDSLIGRGGLLIRNSVILDVFQKQLLNVQFLVTEAKEKLGRKEFDANQK